MVAFVRIISGNFNLKKPEEKRKEYFYNLFSKKGNNRKSDTLTIDTELSIKLPENSTAFLATKFEGQEIQKFIGQNSTNKRLWITLLNESYFNEYQISKGDVIGYLIIEPDNIKSTLLGKRENLEADEKISK